jgi:hypothetical protein
VLDRPVYHESAAIPTHAKDSEGNKRCGGVEKKEEMMTTEAQRHREMNEEMCRKGGAK